MRLVVEQQRERRLAGRMDAVLEGRIDGGAVLLIAHVDADGGAGVRVDAQLEVLVERLAVGDDRDLLAVADPRR